MLLHIVSTIFASDLLECHTKEGEQYLWNRRGEATKKHTMNFKFYEKNQTI